MEYMRKWFLFISERFSPVTYAMMIFVFLGAHYSFYLSFFNQIHLFDFLSILSLFPLVVATFLFFFKLRLLDEVKDIEFDVIYHSERPLPRGILSKNEAVRTAFVLMVTEIIFFGFYGLWVLLSALITVGYSLLMYQEFFIKKWLRAHLTTYAVVHTFVVVLLSITIFMSLLNIPFPQIPKEFIYFSFAGWFIFNIFEFGRKTFAKGEERKGVDSYSKIFGKHGAVFLVLAMTTLASLMLARANISTTMLFLPLSLIGVAGILYIMIENLYFSKIYRFLTSLCIILTYAIVILSAMFKF